MDPMSLAMMGANAFSSLFQGIMGQNQANTQNKIFQDRARQANAEAGISAQEALQQGDQAAAHGAAVAAANGGGFVGSSIGAIQNLSNNAMFNARAQTYRGLTQSQSDLYQAAVARANGQNAMISGIVGAVGGVATQSVADSYRKQILGSISSRQGELGSGSIGIGTGGSGSIGVGSGSVGLS